MPKGKMMSPQMLEDEEDDATVVQSRPSKPKFKLGLGGMGKDGKPSMVPNLDFSNLKHVKENDWYAQCKKLEEVISKLRARVATYEEEKEEIVSSNQAQEKLLRQLQRQIVNLRDQNDRLLDENKKLLDQIRQAPSEKQAEESEGQAEIMEILNNKTSGTHSSGRENEDEEGKGRNS